MTTHMRSTPQSGLPTSLRVMLVVPALAALVCGVLAGLARLGLPVPDGIARLVGVHGALMVGGFFGTLIGLERAVALGLRWPYLGPMLSGFAALALLFGAPLSVSPVLMSLASLSMLAACVVVWRRQRVAHHAALAMAALAWLLGNLVWATDTLLAAVPLWITFLVLTIAAERLELSRFVPTPRRARIAFSCIVAVLFSGALCSLISVSGLRMLALALFALSLWLLRYDIARRTVRIAGLTRYMAVCLLSGYAWLALGALLGAAGALQAGYALRDAGLHAMLLGFVFSMVFGHAPVILPAITRLSFRWHAGFYLPLLALHLTLSARVLAGLSGWFAMRQWSAVSNALVLLLFVLMVAVSLVLSTRGKTLKRHRGTEPAAVL